MLNEEKEILNVVFNKIKTTLTSNSFIENQKKLKQILDEQKKGNFSNPNFEIIKEQGKKVRILERKINPWLELEEELNDLKTFLEMAQEETGEEYVPEIQKQLRELQRKLNELEKRYLFKEENDEANCYLTIQAGAGGTESCDWASMLYRLYSRWAEKKKFKFSIIDYQSGEEIGLKSTTVLIEGLYAYGLLKSENGVHRLVRISPFDANKKRHTSFVSLNVVAELKEDINIKISPSELRIDTYRSSGAGGQHVNTTDSAVRITHLPTHIVVSCQAERSQHQNKEKALKILKARLYEHYRKEKEAQKNATLGEKKKIEWGSQIRSYTFHPYNLIKDHRSNFETGNINAVMDGEIDEFIFAYLKSIL